MKKQIGKKKFAGIFGLAVLMIGLAAGLGAFALTKKNAETKKQEQLQAERAQANRTQTVSTTVTEEGTVSVGTNTQTFALDLSEYSQSDSTSFSWQAGNAFPQMGDIMGTQTTDSSGRKLTVEEVYVEVGEEVHAGDPILKVTADTLSTIADELEADAEEAKAVYEQTLTSGQQSLAEAKAELSENQLYGTYADTEYLLAVSELSETVDSLQAQIEEVQQEKEETESEIAELQSDLEEQSTALENAAYVVKNQDRLEDTYGWLTAVNAKEDIERTMESLESSLETDQENLESLETELESLNRQLLEAQAALETGTIEAESARKTRNLKSENAEEIYDVAAQKAAFETQNAKDDYETAQARLEELQSYLKDQVIVAEADGVITEVPVGAGDSLVSDTELFSYNSYDEVTITLTVDESDLDAAALGSSAEILIAAFPDEIFEGTVTKIGDAQINSNTNTTVYEVVVTITKNASKLYEGMTAEVTFYRENGEETAS